MILFFSFGNQFVVLFASLLLLSHTFFFPILFLLLFNFSSFLSSSLSFVQLKVLVRSMYSSPPLYGARIVAEILSTPELRAMWAGECKDMAERIKEMRHALKSELSTQGSSLSWNHVTDQIGMFCFTGLTEEQVLRLRNEHHIYCTDDGRISIAGMNTKNVAIVAAALHSVTSS